LRERKYFDRKSWQNLHEGLLIYGHQITEDECWLRTNLGCIGVGSASSSPPEVPLLHKHANIQSEKQKCLPHRIAEKKV
jgi:hypothetical protein